MSSARPVDPSQPADPAVAERLRAAVEVAREAGEITLRHFQSTSLGVERKGDDSPVTVADRASEQHLRERIRRLFPDDGIVGEEFGETPGASPYRWVLDPIDGTKTFIQGVPLYGTLVGIESGGNGIAGVIHLPALAETVYGALGQGAWWQRGERAPEPARTSGKQRLADSLLLTTDVEHFGRRGATEAYRQLAGVSRLARTWGDCYGYALVATGRAEVMIDPFLHVWDAAALLPVLVEAGGAFASWRGVATIHGGDGVGAASRELLDEALAVTSRFPTPE